MSFILVRGNKLHKTLLGRQRVHKTKERIPTMHEIVKRRTSDDLPRVAGETGSTSILPIGSEAGKKTFRVSWLNSQWTFRIISCLAHRLIVKLL